MDPLYVKVLTRKVLNLIIGLRVVLIARRRHRSWRTLLRTTWLG